MTRSGHSAITSKAAAHPNFHAVDRGLNEQRNDHPTGETDSGVVIIVATSPSCSCPRGPPRSPVLEVVIVDLRYAQRLVTDADAVVDHQRGKLLAVDEHDAATSFGGGLLRVLA